MVRLIRFDPLSKSVEIEFNRPGIQDSKSASRTNPGTNSRFKTLSNLAKPTIDFKRPPSTAPGRKVKFNLPSGGLVPLGDTGLYMTPLEPASPTDCDRFPSSPWCGASPFAFEPVAFNPSIAIDHCNIGVRVDSVLAFIKLPPISLVWRRPECRNQETPPQTPFNPPKGDYSIPVAIPANTCLDSTQGMVGVAFPNYTRRYREQKFYDGNTAISTNIVTVNLIRFDFYKPGQKLVSRTIFTGSSYATINVDVVAEVVFKVKSEFVFNSHYNNAFWQGRAPQLGDDKYGIIQEQEKSFVLTRIDRSYSPRVSGEFADQSFFWINDSRFFREATNYRNYHQTEFSEEPYYNAYNLRTEERHFTIDIKCGSGILPPPPPLPERQCCMGCCPNTSQDDELLRLLLKKVEKLSEIVGVDEFPAKAPKRLTYPNGKGDIEIKNLVEFLGYQVKQIDRAVGFLPQKIKIADTNPGLAGNQSVEVEIHSFADFAKELMQYMLDVEGDVDVTNNMLVRVLYELGFVHQGVVQGDAMLDAICEHLDFKQKWKKISVPFAFDPHAGTKGKVGQGFDKQKNNQGKGAQTEEDVEKLLPKLLQNTEVDIRVLTNDEKKSLNDQIIDLKRDTAIAAAALSEPAGSNRLDQLVAAAQLLVQLQGAVDRKNTRQAMVGGDLRTNQKD